MTSTSADTIKGAQGLISAAFVAMFALTIIMAAVGRLWFTTPPQRVVTVTHIVRSQGYTGGLFSTSVPSELIRLSNRQTLNVLIASQPWVVTLHPGSHVVYYSRSQTIHRVHAQSPNHQYTDAVQHFLDTVPTP